MNGFVIMFMIIASLFAVATLGYVAVDTVLEVISKEFKGKAEVKEEKEEEEDVVWATPVAPVVVEPEVVPHADNVDAAQADAMLSDFLAMKTANYERGAGHGQYGIINIGVLNDRFEANDVITLALLKEKGLMPKKAGRMKILADGVLSKPLTIKAENYSIQAIKMIELTGGTVIILKD